MSESLMHGMQLNIKPKIAACSKVPLSVVLQRAVSQSTWKKKQAWPKSLLSVQYRIY